MKKIPKFEEVFRLSKSNLKLMGMPFDDKLQAYFYLFFLMIILMLIAEISFFVTKISNDNFLKLLELAPCIGHGLSGLLKIGCCFAKRRKISKIIHCLEPLYQEIAMNSRKKMLVGKSISLIKTATKFYFIFCIILINIYNFWILIFILIHFYKTSEFIYALPFAILLPFSTETFPSWLLVYIYSCICGYICVYQYTTVDTLYYILTSLVCNQFTLLSDEVLHLSSNIQPKDLKPLIERHQYLFEISSMLEDVFTLPNLFNVLVGSLEICALGFSITTGNASQMPGFLIFLMSILLQIFMMSVFGENLMSESFRVFEAVYLGEWLNMDQRCKKIMLIIMTRAYKPQKLTAYKFSTICYTSFTTIMSSSWTYFTILRTVYTPPENIKIE